MTHRKPGTLPRVLVMDPRREAPEMHEELEARGTYRTIRVEDARSALDEILCSGCDLLHVVLDGHDFGARLLLEEVRRDPVLDRIPRIVSSYDVRKDMVETLRSLGVAAIVPLQAGIAELQRVVERTFNDRRSLSA